MKAEHAWGLLGLGVFAYDMLCEEGHTLSEGFRKQPLALQIGEVALMGVHLLNVAPKYDPIHQTYKVLR